MDTASIHYGEDFRERIDAEVSECDVVLAVIGMKWTGDSDRHRRIDDPRDFVRIELESALQRKLPVIPILIDHVKMPGESDLPSSLRRLAFRNAMNVDQGRDFDHHVSELIGGIEVFFRAAQRSSPTETKAPSDSGLFRPAASSHRHPALGPSSKAT